MKILIADKFEPAGLEGLKRLGCEVVYEPSAGGEQLGAALEKARPDLLVVRSTKVPAGVLEKAAGLKGIIRAGAGVDNIDLPAASSRGIPVANCPGMNAVAVAELAMAHLLCCDRRVPDQTADLRAGTWNKKEYSRARGLKGLSLAVIGLGAIGRAVVQRAKAFEMDVVGWSRSLTPEGARALGIRFGGNDRASLLKLAGACDAITLHVAGSAETKQMCDAAFFGAIKKGAYFINTSRGSVVDEKALREAVKAKGLRVGMDVYENQPGTPQTEFASETARLPGVCCTHHVGASTDQAQQAVAEEVVRLVDVFGKTGRLENCVNEGDLAAGKVNVVRGVPAGATRS